MKEQTKGLRVGDWVGGNLARIVAGLFDEGSQGAGRCDLRRRYQEEHRRPPFKFSEGAGAPPFCVSVCVPAGTRLLPPFLDSCRRVARNPSRWARPIAIAPGRPSGGWASPARLHSLGGAAGPAARPTGGQGKNKLIGTSPPTRLLAPGARSAGGRQVTSPGHRARGEVSGGSGESRRRPYWRQQAPSLVGCMQMARRARPPVCSRYFWWPPPWLPVQCVHAGGRCACPACWTVGPRTLIPLSCLPGGPGVWKTIRQCAWHR
ncbi:unnamed protein product, partial [Amoebophrya sp. A120]|eukprot:GSA120T00021148001.1